MRRALLVLALATLAAGLAGTPASAHPLGNFSINHLTQVRVSDGRVELRYLLDQAEIPTFQERGLSVAAILARKRAEVERGLTVTVDGRPVVLRPSARPLFSHPPGQGGLPLTRVELPFVGAIPRRGRLVVHDGTYADRVGWKAIVAEPGKGTAVRSSAPSGDPTHGLRFYPKASLSSPLDEREASFTVAPGQGTLTAPRQPGAGATTTNVGGDGFAGVFASAAAGRGVLVLFLLAAFAWGAIHALSPGHGKTMVAAYLVGMRGTPRHAVVLGAVTTLTHTIGVFALGLVTLVLAQYVVPEQLYPWLSLASGLLVLSIGGAALRSRLRWRRRQMAEGHDHGHDHAHGHDHDHAHDQEHDHAHDHGHDHATGPSHEHAHSHGEGHHHHHHLPDRITWKGLVGMGASAGLIPCPSALVVLLGAIAQHQLALGLLLIVAFSLGLAATLTGLGLALVGARRMTTRVSFGGRFTSALPALSTVLILGLGLIVTARAIPQLL